MKKRGARWIGRVRKMIATAVMLVLMVGLLPEMLAEAATAHKYWSCFGYNRLNRLEMGKKYSENQAATNPLNRGLNPDGTVSVTGWVLSNMQVSSYEVYFSYGNNTQTDLSNVTYSHSMKAEAFDWEFSTDYDDLIAKNKFIRKNSGWRADVPVTGLREGTWLFVVKGKRKKDSELFDVAKFAIFVKNDNKFAVGRTVPDLKTQYSGNSNYYFNSNVTMKEELVAGGQEYVEVSGWALCNSGIKGYEYRVTDKNGKILKKGEVAAYDRDDLEKLSQLLNISRADSHTNTGYEDRIPITGLGPGEYRVEINGVTFSDTRFSAGWLRFTLVPAQPKKITLTGKEKDHVITDDFCYVEGDRFFLLLDKGADIPGDLAKNISRIMKDLEARTGLKFDNGRKLDRYLYGTLTYGYDPWGNMDFGKKVPIYVSVARTLDGLCPNSCAEYSDINVKEFVSDEVWNQYCKDKDRSKDWKYYVIAHELTHVLVDRHAKLNGIMKEGSADFYAELVVNDMNYKSFAGSKEYVKNNLGNSVKDKITAKSAETIFRSDYSDRPHTEFETEAYVLGRMICKFLMEDYGETFLRDYLTDVANAGYAYPEFHSNLKAADRDVITDLFKKRFGSDVFKKFAVYYKKAQ